MLVHARECPGTIGEGDMSDITVLDLQKLRQTKCACCGEQPSDEHPVALTQVCHPGTGLALAYVGGDKVLAFCRMCGAFCFRMIVGESAQPKALDGIPGVKS